MILLAKEKDIGIGCTSCRFLDKSKEKAVCIADSRVCVYHDDGSVIEHRPYTCPFRYFDDNTKQNISKFYGMTEEETKGWFEGMDSIVYKYINLEEKRDMYVKYKMSLNESEKRNDK